MRFFEGITQEPREYILLEKAKRIAQQGAVPIVCKMTIFQDGSKVLVSGGNIIQINFIVSIFRTLRSVDRITGRTEFKTGSSYISKWYPIRLRIEFGRRFLTIHVLA